MPSGARFWYNKNVNIIRTYCRITIDVPSAFHPKVSITRFMNKIEDRVGGGDGFCSGFIYGLLHEMTPQECVEKGTAHGALLQSTRGDTSMVTMAEIKYVMNGGSARIKR
jgi:Sugar kinases, ribokinase family